MRFAIFSGASTLHTISRSSTYYPMVVAS